MPPTAPGRPSTAPSERLSSRCVMVAFLAQRRAVLRPFPCNTVIGIHSPAKCGPRRRKLWPRREGRHSGNRSSNDVQGASSATAVRRVRRRRRARSTEPRSCARSPTAACTTRPRGRIENTAPAFLAAIDKGYGIECDLQAAKDGTPMVFHDDKLDRLLAAPGRISRTHARSPRAPALQGPGRAHPHLRRVPGPGRRPRAAAGGGQDQQPPPRCRRSSTGSRARRGPTRGPIALMSFDRDVVAALGQLAPTVPRGPVIGSHELPTSWWATPSAAGSADHRARAQPCAGRQRLPRRRRADAARARAPG